MFFHLHLLVTKLPSKPHYAFQPPKTQHTQVRVASLKSCLQPKARVFLSERSLNTGITCLVARLPSLRRFEVSAHNCEHPIHMGGTAARPVVSAMVCPAKMHDSRWSSANEILRMPVAYLRLVLLRHNIPYDLKNLAGVPRLFFCAHFLHPLSTCACTGVEKQAGSRDYFWYSYFHIHVPGTA